MTGPVEVVAQAAQTASLNMTSSLRRRSSELLSSVAVSRPLVSLYVLLLLAAALAIPVALLPSAERDLVLTGALPAAGTSLVSYLSRLDGQPKASKSTLAFLRGLVMGGLALALARILFVGQLAATNQANATSSEMIGALVFGSLVGFATGSLSQNDTAEFDRPARDSSLSSALDSLVSDVLEPQRPHNFHGVVEVKSNPVSDSKKIQGELLLRVVPARSRNVGSSFEPALSLPISIGDREKEEDVQFDFRLSTSPGLDVVPRRHKLFVSAGKPTEPLVFSLVRSVIDEADVSDNEGLSAPDSEAETGGGWVLIEVLNQGQTVQVGEFSYSNPAR